MEWLKRHKGRLFFLFVLVFLAYFNSLNNEFVSDDIFAIVNNKNLGDFSQILNNPFYFLRPLEYFVIFHLFGRNAFYFRLVSFLSHVLAVWGVYGLVGLICSTSEERRLGSRTHSSGKSRPMGNKSGESIGFVAAVLFAVHPLGVEAVSWISAGGYVQMTAFAVWSLVFYVLVIKNSEHRCRPPKVAEQLLKIQQVRNHLSLRYYVLSLAFLVLALFSMERAVVVVGLMFMVSFVFGDLKREWRYLIAPAFLSLVWLGVSLRGVGVRQETLQVNFYDEPEKVDFWLQTPVAISEYLKLFVWPVGLTLYHSDLVFTGWQIVARVGLALGLILATVWAFFRRKRLFFWLIWFLFCLSPTLLPLGISWVVAERYVYMAMIGLVALAAMGFNYLKWRFGSDEVGLILVLLVAGLMFRTILRNNDWQRADDLYLSAERYSVLSPQNHNNLGDVYGKRGDLKKSEWHFKRAIELNPRYADAMHNLGNTYLRMGEIEKARESFRRALEANPNLWQSERMLEAIEK